MMSVRADHRSVRIVGLLTILITALQPCVSAVTPQQVPQFDGVVFGFEATGGEEDAPTIVYLMVFSESLGTFREYRVDVAAQTVMSLRQSTMTVVTPGWEWQVPYPTGIGHVAFLRNSDGQLFIDDEGSAAHWVDYQSQSHLARTSCTHCAWACVWNGCCQCCLCFHRCAGVPEILDKLCCEWLGENYCPF